MREGGMKASAWGDGRRDGTSDSKARVPELHFWE